jgi:hypothetical protein
MSSLVLRLGRVDTLHSQRRDRRCKQKHVDNPVVKERVSRDTRAKAPTERVFTRDHVIISDPSVFTSTASSR